MFKGLFYNEINCEKKRKAGYQVKTDYIPKAIVQRMATYVQVLEGLLNQNLEIVSSATLAQECGVNSSQIRKDLAYFGEFGVRGVGYYVRNLLISLKHFLGIDRVWHCALVGVGNLGRAILRHKQMKSRGFIIVAAFDCDPFKISEVVAEHEIICTRKLKEKAEELHIDMGIITTPPERAQRAANHLVEAGIKGIINFAPVRIHVPEHVSVDYVDFSNNFISLAFDIIRQHDTSSN